MSSKASLCADDICAVVVTYGDRYHLLLQVLSSIEAAGIRETIVVFNGNFAAEKIPADAVITAIKLPSNTGSAGGYRAGLASAMQTGKPYLLLLDDDNLLTSDCLRELCAAHAQLGGTPDICLHAFRPPLEWHRILLEQGIQTIARPNTYAWFHIANTSRLLPRQLGLKKPSTALGNTLALRESSVACYGGLLLSQEVLRKAGMPSLAFFCYYDDLEFSSRLRHAGARLFLCGRARIEDAEASWHVSDGPYHPAFSPATSDQRLFLDLRNAVFFSRARISNRFIYALNRLCFWAGIAYLALLRSPHLGFSLRRLRLIHAAIRDGEQGRLGPPSTEMGLP